MTHQRSKVVLTAFIAAATVFSAATSASAQQYTQPAGRYFPLNQSTPPGIAAQWHSLSAGTTIGSPQAVRVEVTGGATVSFFDGSAAEVDVQPSPAQTRLAVGHTYRLKITGLPGFPGVDLYPSVEILDQLHPPQGHEDVYSIPLVITQDEIAKALEGRMVTKVVYLEPPRQAVGVQRSLAESTTTMPNRANLFAEADRLGRPMAIIRLGSRTPSLSGPNHHFFGTGGPVQTISPQFVPAAADQKNAAATPASGRARVSLVNHVPGPRS